MDTSISYVTTEPVDFILGKVQNKVATPHLTALQYHELLQGVITSCQGRLKYLFVFKTVEDTIKEMHKRPTDFWQTPPVFAPEFLLEGVTKRTRICWLYYNCRALYTLSGDTDDLDSTDGIALTDGGALILGSIRWQEVQSESGRLKAHIPSKVSFSILDKGRQVALFNRANFGWQLLGGLVEAVEAGIKDREKRLESHREECARLREIYKRIKYHGLCEKCGKFTNGSTFCDTCR